MNVQTILIPTDFSKLSEEAITVGVALARVFSARVILLHVINRPSDLDELAAAYDEYYAYTRDQISGSLEEFGEKIRKEGVRVETELVSGIPHEEIVQIAEKKGVDMIVLGTHGRRGFDRLLMGSQAEQVVRVAPCPVITVKGSLKEVKEEAKKEEAKEAVNT